MKQTISGLVNQKSLTYFFIMVLLLTAGTAFPKSVSNVKLTRFSGNSAQEIAEKGTVCFSAFSQCSPLTDLAQNLGNNQPALSEKSSIYLLRNYILSNISIPFAENTRRTSIWFTSRLKN